MTPGYPKNSQVLIFVTVVNCDVMETTLIKIFKEKFLHRKDYGREYFQGDKDQMMLEIYNKCQEELINNSIDPQLSENSDKQELSPKQINNDHIVNPPILVNLIRKNSINVLIVI